MPKPRSRTALAFPRLFPATTPTPGRRIAVRDPGDLAAPPRIFDPECAEFARHLLRENDALRRELALALHDDVLSGLATIKLKIEALAASSPSADLQDLHRQLGAILDRARTVAHQTWPPELDSLGLHDALLSLAHQAALQSGIHVEFSCAADLHALDRDRSITLYRVAQESLANVVRHSGASRARVLLSSANAGLRLTVHDNGRGFPQTVLDGAAPHEHALRTFGLTGIRYRMAAVGGRVRFVNRKSGGAEVVATLPLAQPGSRHPDPPLP
jgi:signal transduction histidine kinase